MHFCKADITLPVFTPGAQIKLIAARNIICLIVNFFNSHNRNLTRIGVSSNGMKNHVFEI